MILYSFGIGLISAVCVYFAIQYVFEQVNDSLIISKLNLSEVKAINRSNYYALIGGVMSAIIGFVLSYHTQYTILVAGFFLVIGIGAFKISFTFLELRNLERRKKECYMLFKTVIYLMQTGKPMQIALKESRPLFQQLDKAISKTLSSWHKGTIKAIKVLQEEIDLPEGDQLASLLMQLEQSGVKNYGSIVQKETQRLEEKRRSDERKRIDRKPIFMLLYQAIPFLIVMLFMMGVIFTKIYIHFSQIF